MPDTVTFKKFQNMKQAWFMVWRELISKHLFSALDLQNAQVKQWFENNWPETAKTKHSSSLLTKKKQSFSFLWEFEINQNFPGIVLIFCLTMRYLVPASWEEWGDCLDCHCLQATAAFYCSSLVQSNLNCGITVHS